MEIFPYLLNNSPRLQQWLILSFKLSVFNSSFQNSIYRLGRIDCSLRNCDARRIDYIKSIEKENFNVEFFGDYDFLSDLWVIGTFDIVSYLLKKIKNPKKNDTELIGKVNALKRKILRIRTLITKFKSCCLDLDDLNRPWLGSSKNKGKFWQLNNKDKVCRNDLSDKFISTLDQFDDTLLSLITINKKKFDQSLYSMTNRRFSLR